jgi:hypothetical protein
MPLFKKASRPPPPAAQPHKGLPADKLMGDSAAHWFRGELAQGRWQELHDFRSASAPAPEGTACTG